LLSFKLHNLYYSKKFTMLISTNYHINIYEKMNVQKISKPGIKFFRQ